MTVAVGIITKTGVSLLADRRVTNGTAIGEMTKIVQAGKYHFALAGFNAGFEPLRAALLKTRSVEGLREHFEVSGWTPDTDPGEPMCVHICALITDGKTLWRMDGSLATRPILSGFAAIGTGAYAALGALHAGASPEQAIEIASRIDSSCGNGFDRVDVKRRGR